MLPIAGVAGAEIGRLGPVDGATGGAAAGAAGAEATVAGTAALAGSAAGAAIPYDGVVTRQRQNTEDRRARSGAHRHHRRHDKTGAGGVIPPDADLDFEVELLAIGDLEANLPSEDAGGACGREIRACE